MTPAQKKQRQAQIRSISAGFSLPFNADKYIDAAIRLYPQDAATYAWALILRSKEFKVYFPGIFNPNHTLRMSVPEYNQRTEAYSSIFAQYGTALDRATLGALIANNVDPGEARIRARGLQLVRTNKDMLLQMQQTIGNYNAQRKAAGLPPIPSISTTKQAVDFFTGRADAQVYNLYEAALVRGELAGVGFDIAVDQARDLANKTEGVLEQADVQQKALRIVARLKRAGVEIHSFGVSDRDLLTLEFGGPGQADIIARTEQALKQRDAALENPLATKRTTLTPEGRPVLAAGSLTPGM